LHHAGWQIDFTTFRVKAREMRLRPFFIATLLLMIALPMAAQASQVGTAAPECNLPDLNGKTVALQQLKGKVVLLDFWAPWCDQCKEELPALEALFGKYKNNGFVVIGVDIDTSEKLLTEFLQKTPVAFTVLMDNKGVMRRAYRFRSLPTAFIIDKNGVIRHVHMGFGTELLPTFENEITELLKQP
jgi:peroxiredoxin